MQQTENSAGTINTDLRAQSPRPWRKDGTSTQGPSATTLPSSLRTRSATGGHIQAAVRTTPTRANPMAGAIFRV